MNEKILKSKKHSLLFPSIRYEVRWHSVDINRSTFLQRENNMKASTILIQKGNVFK